MASSGTYVLAPTNPNYILTERNPDPTDEYCLDITLCRWWIEGKFWYPVGNRYKEKLLPKLKSVAAATISRNGQNRTIVRPEYIGWDFLKGIYAVPAVEAAPDPFYHTTALFNSLMRRNSIIKALRTVWRNEETLGTELNQYTQAHRQLSKTLSCFGTISDTLRLVAKRMGFFISFFDDFPSLTGA